MQTKATNNKLDDTIGRHSPASSLSPPAIDEESESLAPRLSATDHHVLMPLHPPSSSSRDTLLLSFLLAIASDLESAEDNAVRVRAQKRLADTQEILEKTVKLTLLDGTEDATRRSISTTKRNN